MTKLDGATPEELLATHYEACVGESPQMAPLGGGWDNENYLVTTKDGARLVLRRYLISTLEEVKYEVELVKNLVRAGYPTPRMYRNAANEYLSVSSGRAVVLFEYIAGARPAEAHELDAVVVLAHRLHALGFGFGGPSVRRKFSDLGTRMARHAAGRAGADFGWLMDFMSRWQRGGGSALQAGHSQLRKSCVHYDLNPSNVLVVGDHYTVIDFDECVYAPVIVELAGMIHYWCIDDEGALDLERASDVVRRYDALLTLRGVEHELLPHALIEYQLRDCLKYCVGELDDSPGFELSASISFRALKHLVELFDSRRLTVTP